MRPPVSFYDKPPTYGNRCPANVYRFFPFRTTPNPPATRHLSPRGKALKRSIVLPCHFDRSEGKTRTQRRNPPRGKNISSVYATSVFPSGRLPRYGYAFARNDRAVSVCAWFIIRVRLSSFLLRVISRWRAATGERAGAGTRRAVSTVGDFSTTASPSLEMTTCTYESIRLIAITTLLAYKNDDVFILVFNVISTGVRVKPERSGEIPPREKYFVRVRNVRFPFREIATSLRSSQ